MRTLQLTSPLMRGDDVRMAQAKLKRHQWLEGLADGVYGPDSARATRRAKFWCGYTKLATEGANGDAYGSVLDRLIGLLDANKPLPEPYATRRKDRLASAALKEKNGSTLREKTLANLVKHLGETESPPGSNIMPWATGFYGLVGPWCAMAVTRAAVDAGSTSFKRGKVAAYVPYIVQWANAGQLGFRRTYKPLPGHLVTYDWTGDGVFDHVGLVEVPPKSLAPGTPMVCVEGNTSADSDRGGSQSNGGGCFRRHRTVLGAGQIVFASYA